MGIRRVYSLATLMLIASLVVSCGESDPEPVSKLVGTWSTISSVSIVSVDGKSYEDYLMSIGFTQEDAINLTEEMERDFALSNIFNQLEFTANGKWSGVNDFSSSTGGWQLSMDERTLTISNDAESGIMRPIDVTRLSETELRLEGAFTNPPPGAPEKFIYKAIAEFKKL